MDDTTDILQSVREKLKELEESKKELYLLRHVAGDLRTYGKMIPIKMYD
jgi:hypothetical protein